MFPNIRCKERSWYNNEGILNYKYASVPDFTGQSRILYLVPGVLGTGYNVPDFRGF